MKLFKWLPLILLFSCIDIITQTTHYNSLYFQGGSWMAIERMDSMKMEDASYDFTLQFWVSGSDVYSSDAPALFSLVDPQDNIKLALFRDSGKPSAITAIVNSIIFDTVMDELDWEDSDEFYLISILFSEENGLKGFINDDVFLDMPNESVIVSETKLMIGARISETLYPDHFWYGYIDEIRLWNTLLADSTIQFQATHPSKLGDYYRYSYLDSLIGIWRFNLSEATATIIDESDHGYDGTIYTLNNNYFIKLSEKGAQ